MTSVWIESAGYSEPVIDRLPDLIHTVATTSRGGRSALLVAQLRTPTRAVVPPRQFRLGTT